MVVTSIFDRLVSRFHPTQVLLLEGFYFSCGTERVVSQNYYNILYYCVEPFHHTVLMSLTPVGNKALIVPL